jgi:hypothetical protein
LIDYDLMLMHCVIEDFPIWVGRQVAAPVLVHFSIGYCYLVLYHGAELKLSAVTEACTKSA